MELEEAIELKLKVEEIIASEEVRPYSESQSSNRQSRGANYIQPFMGISATEEGYKIEMRIVSPSDCKRVKHIEEKIGQKINYQIIKPIIQYNQYSSIASVASPRNILSIGSTISRSHSEPLMSGMLGWLELILRMDWIRQRKIQRGTLGCFVIKPECPQEILILSNNHVLANLNNANINDPIVFWEKQQGDSQEELRYSSNPKIVAHLLDFIHLTENDCIDAAIAKVIDSNGINSNEINGLGYLKGFRDKSQIRPNCEVHKLGSTTGLTKGRITQFRATFKLPYGQLICTFNDVIEIEGMKLKPFSRPGDSGSIIVEQDLREEESNTKDFKALALLVAGTMDYKKTYAIPISTVFEKLGVGLAFLDQ